MSQRTEKLYLEIPKDLIQEPIIYALGTRFNVVPNIRAGSITETVARIALEITGPSDEIDRAIEYIKNLGVTIKPIEEGDE